jgi:predicted DCC family thiol-disulfide oxidoreductase YuxK
MAGEPNLDPVDWPDDRVILYDGVCVLCSGWVRFVAARDPDRLFRFTAIQSEYGRALSAQLGIDPDAPDTNALVLGGKAYRRSDAAIAVLSRLPGWGWFGAARLVPRPLRDALYWGIARNRYRVFGRHHVCDLGGPDLRDRVIGGG